MRAKKWSARTCAVAAVLTTTVAGAPGALAAGERGTFRAHVENGVAIFEQIDHRSYAGLSVFDGNERGMDPESFESGTMVTFRENSALSEFRDGAGCTVSSDITMNCSPVRRVRMVLGNGNNFVTTYAFDSQAWTTFWLNMPLTVYANGGHDDIGGGFGDDRLYGGPGRDRLSGDDGDDVLHAGKGVAGWEGIALGGRGNDIVFTANGAPDGVTCGAGTDTATVDQLDSVRGCEHVTRRHVTPVR